MSAQRREQTTTTLTREKGGAAVLHRDDTYKITTEWQHAAPRCNMYHMQLIPILQFFRFFLTV